MSPLSVRASVALTLMGQVAGIGTVPSNGAPADLFAASGICQVSIEMAPQNIESLRTASRKYVPAKISILGEVFREVGLHLKGSGSFRNIDQKPGFTLDFERFVPGQRFRGLQKIHLNNSVEDPTYLKEQLGCELFRAAGVPIPRLAHALVELNGRRLGLYVLKEGFTEDFLQRHFERSDGNLYDTDEGQDVNLPMKRHLGPASANQQPELERLAAAALEANLERRWARLQQTLEVDRFLTFIAIEIMICHWDGYCLGRNNFKVFHNLGTDRIVFFPSGMDQVFSKADMPWKPDMAGLVARAVMEVPEGRKQYRARFQHLFSSLFLSGQLTNRVNQRLADLRAYVHKAEFEEMRREAAELCERIVQRELNLRKQLREPEPALAKFSNDLFVLTGWKAVDAPVEGRMGEVTSPEGKLALQIVAGSRTSASWRTTLRLSEGRYLFRGNAQVAGIIPLPFGRNQGASLRVAGKMQRSACLTGTSGWKSLETDFEVRAPEEEIVFICELRGRAGEAQFDKSSLVVIRQQ